MEDFKLGDKIQYRLFDKHNKEHWFDGAIHGMRQYEDDDGHITKRSYLIDTGRDIRKEESSYNERDRAIGAHIQKAVENGATHEDALVEAHKRSDLPKSKVVTERFRQPEQIELTAENIRQV